MDHVDWLLGLAGFQSWMFWGRRAMNQPGLTNPRDVPSRLNIRWADLFNKVSQDANQDAIASAAKRASAKRLASSAASTGSATGFNAAFLGAPSV
jgi:hypothetical protein